MCPFRVIKVPCELRVFKDFFVGNWSNWPQCVQPTLRLVELTADVFLGPMVRHLLLSTPVVSFFFRTFQIVVLTMANVCAIAQIDFPSSPIDSSLVFMLVMPLCSLQRQNQKLKVRVDIENYLLFE